MAHFSGQTQSQGSSKKMCDYCHQHPKFPPYDYCSKACGSRAKGSGSTHSRAPTLCKQCGQRPVYKGHQFCGKNCANTWQAVNGPTSTSSYGSSYGSSQPQYGQQQSWYMGQPKTQYPPTSSTQPFQGLGQGVAGALNSFKGPAPQSQQPQQSRLPRQLSPPNLSRMPQIPGHISPPPLMIAPPVSPMSSGMSGPRSPGSNQLYYTPSTSPSIQDLNGNGLANSRRAPSPPLPPIPDITNGQNTNMAANPPSYSVFGRTQSNDSDPDTLWDPNQDRTGTPNSNGGSISAQAQFSVRVVSPHTGSGGSGNGDLDPNDPALFPSIQYMSNPPGLSSTCQLIGCDKPVFVDPETNHQSEYCTQKHREEATTSGQVAPCIMCKKMPRRQDDHFCSRGCVEKALSA